MASLLWLYGIGMTALVALYTVKRWGDKPSRTKWLIPEMIVGPDDRLVIRSLVTLDRNQASHLIQEWKAVWDDESNQKVIVVDPCFELSVIRGKTEDVEVVDPSPETGYYGPPFSEIIERRQQKEQGQ